MSQSIRYETVECSRCGGTGHYSYNPMDGTICFKCRGAKRTSSKKGAAAREKVEEFKMSLYSVAAGDVEPGTQLHFTRYGWRTVTKMEEDRLNEGMVILRTKAMSFHVQPSDRYKARPTPEEWAQTIEFARALPGVQIIEKEEVG